MGSRVLFEFLGNSRVDGGSFRVHRCQRFLGGAPPGGEAPSVVGLVMSVRPCIHPKP